MSNIVIQVEKLAKRYRIGQRERYKALRDVVTDKMYAPFRRLSSFVHSPSTDRDGRPTTTDEWIWALKDVSFAIKRGETVGIIGRNGAGKTTMLKILSRITGPTKGSVEIHGRVGSLLEVGTGFHPELTGRENIYLNGAILGMKKAEIDHKFEEIVTFAETEKFLDTPVKRYSSGMRMRLAFAVAAHLETEILVVDEVLAVGDLRFQKKCLNKMQDVEREGRTVLFVSHSMPAVTRLCRRAILLDEGRMLADGPSHQTVTSYLNTGTRTTAQREWPNQSKATKGDIVRLRAVRVRSEKGDLIDTVDIRRPVKIEMEYEVLKAGYMLMPHFQFYNEEGVAVFSAHDLDPIWRRKPRPKGTYVSTVWIPGNLLSEGTMFAGAGLETVEPTVRQFYEHDAVVFHIMDSLDGHTARGDYGGHMTGVVRPLLKWSTQLRSEEAKVDAPPLK